MFNVICLDIQCSIQTMTITWVMLHDNSMNSYSSASCGMRPHIIWQLSRAIKSENAGKSYSPRMTDICTTSGWLPLFVVKNFYTCMFTYEVNLHDGNTWANAFFHFPKVSREKSTTIWQNRLSIRKFILCQRPLRLEYRLLKSIIWG